LLGLALGAGTSASAEILDRVVAVVQPSADQGARAQRAGIERKIFTLSELELETRVVLIQRGGIQAATAPLDEEALRSALDYAIGQYLLTVEADKLQAFTLPEEEQLKALQRFVARFDSLAAFQAFLQRNEADEQQLVAILARGLRADRILDSKVRLRAQVSELEVKRYFDENAGQLQGSFSDVRSMVREKLFRERYAKLAIAEVQRLRAAADIRLVAAFVRPREEA
jgi:hypothetical protein